MFNNGQLKMSYCDKGRRNVQGRHSEISAKKEEKKYQDAQIQNKCRKKSTGKLVNPSIKWAYNIMKPSNNILTE